MEIGIESGQLFITLGGLVLFGIIYAHLVNRLHVWGYTEGYTALLVVVGTMVTLMANTTIHHTDPVWDFVLTVGCFAASGIPMAVNDWLQYVRARHQEQRALAGDEPA